MTAKLKKGYIRPFVLMDGWEKGMNRAPVNVTNWISSLALGPSSVPTFPLQALICGFLLPLVVVESVWTATVRLGTPVRGRLVRRGTDFAPDQSRRATIVSSPQPVGRRRDLPKTDKSSPNALKPSTLGQIRAFFGVVPASLAAALKGVTFPFRFAAIAMGRMAGVVAAALLRVLRGFARLLFWPFLRPARMAVSIIVRLARAVDDRVRRTTLTVSIEGATVRIVVFRGRRVMAWKSAWIGDEFGPLAGPGSGPVGEFRDRVTPSLLKGMIQGVKRGHQRVVVDLPAYTSLIRNLTLTKVGRRYIGPIVESELLESLPFGENQVDLSWCARAGPGLDKRRLQVVALAVPRMEMERTVGLFADSGVSPSAAYTKSTTLAYAVGASNALIIHFEDNTAVIVPVLHGEPWVVHQVACPPDGSGSVAAANALTRAVEQVEAFSPGLPGLEGPAGDEEDRPSAPVVLTGDVLGAGVDPRELEEVLQRPVSPLRTSKNRPLDHPLTFPVAQYASNIGLFLADQAGISPWQTAFHRRASRKTRRNAPPGLNVLPKRHRPPPLPPLLLPIFISLLLAAAGTVPFWERTNAMVGDATALEVRLDFLQGQAKQRRSMVDRELELTGKLKATTDEAAALESRLKETQRHMQTLLARLHVITEDTESHGVSLFGLNPEKDGFAISGTAETHGDVLRYAQAVRDSGHFGDAQITGLEGLGEEAGGRITFRILATEPRPALDADGYSSTTAASETTPTTP